MKILKILLYTFLSIFFYMQISEIIDIGFDVINDKKYLYVDLELNKGKIFLSLLTFLLLTIGIIIKNPK